MRSIGLEIAKYAQSNDDLSEYTGNADVALNDQAGALRSTYDIMSDLYPEWIKMNEAEKASLGLALAGKTQYEVFSATMDNFANAQEATATAMMSNNSAIIENEKYMESLEALKFLGLFKQG